ncbi:putative NADH:ubiquinone oxidoreductase [Helianthus anomalus]
MGVLGVGLYGSNEPTLNFETSVNQSYHVALEIIFYWIFNCFCCQIADSTPTYMVIPDHGEAHYSTCMLLVGILLKMEALIQINMELLPHAHSIFSPCRRLSVCFDNRYGTQWSYFTNNLSWLYWCYTFFLAGRSYDRIRLVYLDEMGGVAIPMPKIFTLFSSFSIVVFPWLPLHYRV